MSSVIKCQALCRWCNHLFFQTTARRSISTCCSKENDKLNKNSFYIYMRRQHRKTQSLTPRQTKTMAGHHFQICEEQQLCALLDNYPQLQEREGKRDEVTCFVRIMQRTQAVSANGRCLINS